MPPALPILLVDDDHLLRAMVARSLEARGWAVAQAGSGEAAVEALEGAPFALVLSDVMMPGMDGVELAAAARALHPGLAVVLMSGMASPQMAARAREAGALRLFDKPLSHADLDWILDRARAQG